MVPQALVGALRSRRDVVAACGLAPSALSAALQWAWRTESPPPRASFLADLHAYALELLAHFRCRLWDPAVQHLSYCSF